MADTGSADTAAQPTDKVPSGELALSGPSTCVDATRLPLRGDLAHIRLAGRCFVPHYAVPIIHVLTAAAALRPTPRTTSEPLADVPAGRPFEVLDIAGDWAWGQLAQDDDDGLVGYLPLNALERP